MYLVVYGLKNAGLTDMLTTCWTGLPSKACGARPLAPG